jgi:acyl dehydratase
MRYFEDFTVGDSFELGSYTISEQGILDFAREFDPQPFHTDPEAARESIYGGLIASGWHTTAIFMRLFVGSLLGDTASLGASGIDELRWLKPVRPGDELSARLTVEEVRASTRHPERGTIRSRCEMHNQHQEVVMTLLGTNLISRNRR